MADADHFRNVILNLLDNANKYSPSQPEITVTTSNRSGKILIAIEDKGMGMDPETRRKVFDKFFRYSTGNIHNIKGFGLGLSYVKAIVGAHKGEVFVQSEVGKGSRFEISMPLVEIGDADDNDENNG
jgi:two-component system phosphate regulon sensor histidine kinase PhoR